jgi:uncharacterized protein (DUF488 family)
VITVYDNAMSTTRLLHTIGHSNHDIGTFVGLLMAQQIETVIDVRSWPASRRLPHFNRALLHDAITAAGMTYLWFGKELGGKTGRDESAPAFRSRLGELSGLAESGRAAIMCAEENPLNCHRTQLLAGPLAAEGVALMHIRGDGSLIADAVLAPERDAQLSLFAEN